MNRIPFPLTLAILLTFAMAMPVLAAPPANDTYPGRVPVGSIPFATSLDTTEATTDADDAEWNATCGAPATDASVWYEYASSGNDVLLLDSAGSDYTVGLAVVVGAPGSFTTVACGPDAVAFEAFAGETYQIVAFDDQEDGGGNGGMLELSMDVAPPPPTVDVTVDPTARFHNATNTVTVTGTVTCDGVADFSFVDITLEQRAGRLLIRGFGSADFICDGTTQAWSAEVFGDNGIFKGGKANAFVSAVACNLFCGEDFEQVTLRLKGG